MPADRIRISQLSHINLLFLCELLRIWWSLLTQIGSTNKEETKYSNEELDYDSFMAEEFKFEEKELEQMEGEFKIKLGNAPPEIFRLKASPTTKIFLSKVNKIPKYLNIEPKLLSRNLFETWVLVSYPGSGSSLLRYYLEGITKILTGSDDALENNQWKERYSDSFGGERRTDNRVWIINSHFPHNKGNNKFLAHKWILLVREPIDWMLSLHGLCFNKSSSRFSTVKYDTLNQNKLFDDLHYFYLKYR